MKNYNKQFGSKSKGDFSSVHFLSLLLLFTFLLQAFNCFNFPTAFAQTQENPGYDKYTELLHKGTYKKEKDGFLERAGNLPALPIELAKKGVEKTLVWVEKTHLNQKVTYAWDKIHEWGFHPTGQQLYDHPLIGFNLLWDRSELIKASPYVENAGFTAWTGLNQWQYYEEAVKFNADNILKTKIYANQLFKYENREREPFYGIGRNTSRGDSFVYKLQGMNYETRWGRWFDLFWGKLNVEGEFRFRDIRISGGKDGAKHNFRDFFKSDSQLTGFNGGEYYTIGFNLMHDDRDNIDFPTKGGYRKFSMLWNQGVNGSPFNFIKYKFEAAQFFPLFNDRNVLGVRFAGESNDRRGSGGIPFFEFARIGGFSSVRGLEYNRFFDKNALWMNFEYRYNVWTFKSFKVNLVPTMDIGQVFGEGGDFKMSKTRVGYGGAIRFYINDRMNIDFEAARANEGTYYYVKYKAPF